MTRFVDLDFEPPSVLRVPEPTRSYGGWIRRRPRAFWNDWRSAQRPPPRWEWFEEPGWNWFVTLTFVDEDVTVRQANARLRAWARRLARGQREHVLVACSISPLRLSRRPHIHALVSFRPDARPPDLSEGTSSWHDLGGGRVTVDPYDMYRLGAEYVAKHGEVEVRVACPRRGRCRRRGCVYAGPWRASEVVLGSGR